MCTVGRVCLWHEQKPQIIRQDVMKQKKEEWRQDRRNEGRNKKGKNGGKSQ